MKTRIKADVTFIGFEDTECPYWIISTEEYGSLRVYAQENDWPRLDDVLDLYAEQKNISSDLIDIDEDWDDDSPLSGIYSAPSDLLESESIYDDERDRLFRYGEV